MKGIVLAGGLGTRLRPITLAVSKQLLPVADKPMIYYPLATLMRARLRHVLIISTEHDLPAFKRLFDDGSSLGMKIEYAVQDRPVGIAQAFQIGEKFIGNDPVTLILGDNIFLNDALPALLAGAFSRDAEAILFSKEVSDPKRYGVVAFDQDDIPVRLEEKPEKWVSNWAVTGLYHYAAGATKSVDAFGPSGRGELEITDFNMTFLKRGTLQVIKLPIEEFWMDTGTFSSLLHADGIIRQKRPWLGCVEEVAFRNGWINRRELNILADKMSSSEYGKYLGRVASQRLDELRTSQKVAEILTPNRSKKGRRAG